MSQTAPKAIQDEILKLAIEDYRKNESIDVDIIIDTFDDFIDIYPYAEDIIRDKEYEFRGSFDLETDIPYEWSRNYEAKSVAKKLSDGRWVGWTYWYGGGKHANPAEIDWISDAYFLDITEEEKVMTVYTFKKKDAA